MTNRTSVSGLVEGIRRIIRTRGLSPRTEEVYLRWIAEFWRFFDSPNWRVVTGRHAEEYLDYLANERRLAPKSRNQAATSLAFLFREVLDSDAMTKVKRAKGLTRIPLVLSHREALRVLNELRGKYYLAAALMYGAGLRVTEAASLRVKDLDFELDQIVVRCGKGGKDRVVPLPSTLREQLKQKIKEVDRLRRRDQKNGGGWASLPGALHRKDPRAGYSLGWQFLFASSKESKDPATGRRGRWHLHRSAVQRQVKKAVRESGIVKNASSHTFRHSFATQSLRDGVDIRTLQTLMGHKDIRTTMIYLHALDQVGITVRSPLDRPLSSDDTPRSDWD
jgi:integron integrase